MRETFVEVRCLVCGEGSHTVLCSPAEVRRDLEYLREFHRRRLRPAKSGGPPRSALADRVDFTQDYTTAIVSCDVCGLVYRTPRPPADAITHAYEADQYGHDRLSAVFEAQTQLYRPKAKRLARWLPRGPSVRIVEVGSFAGGFLAAGGEYGWQMLGVDPGKEVDAFCREHGFRVVQGTLADVKLEANSIDCVAIWNTFDQLSIPRPTVLAARRILRGGGLLALRVPNGDCFRRAQRWLQTLRHPVDGWLRAAMAWNNLISFPYLQGYSVQTLDYLLNPYGFRRIAVDPDTLVRLSDAQTKTWAMWEECVLKTAWRAVYRLGWIPGGGVSLAPWFDVYYRAE